MSDALSRIDALIAGLREQEAPPAPPKKEPEKKDEPEKKEPEKKEQKMTQAASDFVSGWISKLRGEGFPQDQAIATAFSKAREAGYDVPAAPSEDEDPEKKAEPKKDEPKDAEKKDEPKKVEAHAEPEKKPGVCPYGNGGQQKRWRHGQEPGEEPKDEPEKEPEKKDAEEEMEEGCVFTKRQFEMAKAEMESFDQFLDKYQENDETAFKPLVVEGDDPLMARMREVPPQKWFEGCVRSIGEDTPVDDPAALCSWMWWNHMTAEQRKRVKGAQE